MLFNHLKDNDFLIKLDQQKIKIHYLKIILLSYDEQPIKEIQGQVISGTLSVNGNSNVRRTISFIMLADKKSNNLTNLDNDISLNKKIKVYIGYENTIKQQYPQYEDIVWFPCGLFLITKASLTYSTTTCQISVSGQDKMVLLNGTVSGHIPASTTFHESYIIDDEGNITVQEVLLMDIIKEAVNHLGGESLNNIIINDLEPTAKMLIKYNGTNPFYFSNDYNNFIITSSTPPIGYIMYPSGSDVGYMETSFTYPGELIFEAGSTITSVLDKICDILGNFEYFYDVHGHFIFQEIKNYLNNSYDLTTDNINYMKAFSDSSYMYNLENANLILNYMITPKYDSIKNDFIVWGTKDESDTGRRVRYHLAIDEKPQINVAGKYFWKKIDENNFNYYQVSNTNSPPDNNEWELIGIPCDEWREELYRQALIASAEGLRYSYYDQELLAEWRELYDTMNEEWNDTNHWNPNVTRDPAQLKYWLDFISSGSEIGQYSINQIGRRSKIVVDNNISTVFNREIPDIIFAENPNDVTKAEEMISKFNSTGQQFVFITENQLPLFSMSSTGASAYDKIRELLYQFLVYNIQVQISSLPCYYLEPNNLIYIKNKETGLENNFVLTSLNIPLSYTGTMTLTATESLTRV